MKLAFKPQGLIDGRFKYWSILQYVNEMVETLFPCCHVKNHQRGERDQFLHKIFIFLGGFCGYFFGKTIPLCPYLVNNWYWFLSIFHNTQDVIIFCILLCLLYSNRKIEILVDVQSRKSWSSLYFNNTTNKEKNVAHDYAALLKSLDKIILTLISKF